jgi:hypothetical protein
MFFGTFHGRTHRNNPPQLPLYTHTLSRVHTKTSKVRKVTKTYLEIMCTPVEFSFQFLSIRCPKVYVGTWLAKYTLVLGLQSIRWYLACKVNAGTWLAKYTLVLGLQSIRWYLACKVNATGRFAAFRFPHFIIAIEEGGGGCGKLFGPLTSINKKLLCNNLCWHDQNNCVLNLRSSPSADAGRTKPYLFRVRLPQIQTRCCTSNHTALLVFICGCH